MDHKQFMKFFKILGCTLNVACQRFLLSVFVRRAQRLLTTDINSQSRYYDNLIYNLQNFFYKYIYIFFFFSCNLVCCGYMNRVGNVWGA
jgi:hypothetical protein